MHFILNVIGRLRQKDVQKIYHQNISEKSRSRYVDVNIWWSKFQSKKLLEKKRDMHNDKRINPAERHNHLKCIHTKIFENQTTWNGLVSRLPWELSKLNSKDKPSNHKKIMHKQKHRTFTKEDRQMTDMHKKQWSITLVISEMQLKIT